MRRDGGGPSLECAPVARVDRNRSAGPIRSKKRACETTTTPRIREINAAAKPESMIVRKPRNWLALIFTLREGTFARVFPRVFTLTFFSVIVTVVELRYRTIGAPLGATPFMLIGVAISLILGFGNSAAYDRYWEGRKLWGRLVNVSRSVTRQITTLLHAPAEKAAADDESIRSFQREFVIGVIGFVHALKHHLRGTDPGQSLDAFFPDGLPSAQPDAPNRPMLILQQLGERVTSAWRNGWINDFHLPVIEASLTEMTTIQGACERIKNTPLPLAYSVIINRIVAFYCFFLPLGIVDSVGILTPLIVFLIAQAFIGVDEIAWQIGDPFDQEKNCLPLDALTATIEVNLRELLGETDLPPIPQQIDGVLM